MEELSKKELVKKDKKGGFTQGFVHNPSMWDALVILEVGNEWVFGYYQWMKEPKTYFLRKLKYHVFADRMSFMFRNRTYQTYLFLRTNYDFTVI